MAATPRYTPREQDALLAASRLLATFREVDPQMSLWAASALLEIALIKEVYEGEDPSYTKLAENLGVPLSTLSRWLRALETGSDRNGPVGGYKLATSGPHPLHHKAKAAILTPNGWSLMGKIIKAISGGRS